MSEPLILANARIVAPDRVFRGALTALDGLIAALEEGDRVPPGAVDCEGDFLIPGLVELHTDNLERHLHPRPGVHWPRRAAMAAHDADFAAAGATTVFDALRVGASPGEPLGDYAHEAAAAAAALRGLGLLRADHFIHLRCELTSPTLIEEFDRVGGDGRLRLVSIMDHTPGQRQFADLETYRRYQREKKGEPGATIEQKIAGALAAQAAHVGPNRAALLARLAGRGAALATHDDASPEHVAEGRAAGATICEFPTTLAAAEAAKAAGMAVLMGAPNLLRGGSHSGNVSARELAAAGLLDMLSSDYAPAALLLAAFALAEEVPGWDLPRAIGCVTRAPAAAAGLGDRGAILPGLRADLARIWHVERLCVTRGVWREGRRVM